MLNEGNELRYSYVPGHNIFIKNTHRAPNTYHWSKLKIMHIIQNTLLSSKQMKNTETHSTQNKLFQELKGDFSDKK